MNKPRIYLSIVLFCCFLFSCNQEVSRKELKEAERLMLSAPDSALHLLESIPAPEKMSRADYAAYCLLLTEAQDKTYYTFTTDSVIRVAAEYYEKINDKRKLPKVYYYLGRVYQEMQAIPYALEYYLKAESSVGDDFHDRRLLSRIYNSIGSIYTQLHIYDNALEAYKQAEHYLYVCEDSVGLPFVLRNMARIYHVTEKLDSAEFYYLQTVEKATKVENRRALISSLIEISNLYIEGGEIEKAEKALLQASVLKPNRMDSKQLASVYARFYYSCNKIDSALFYLNQSLQSTNLYTKAASYYRLYQIDRDRHLYKTALEYADLYYAYKDSLSQKLEREESLRVQNLYNYQKIAREKESLQKKHDKKQQHIVFLICFFFFLSLLGFLFMLYQRQRRKSELLLYEKQIRLKEELYEKSQKRITENQEQIMLLEYKLQEKDQKLDEAEKVLVEKQKEFLQRENLRIELANENKQLQYEQFYSTTIYNKLKSMSHQKCMDDSTWEELKIIIDQLFNRFNAQLMSYYPKMSEKDRKICYLIKIKFSVNEIAGLLGVSKSAVSQSRKRLYEKIYGTSGSAEELDRFIDSL